MASRRSLLLLFATIAIISWLAACSQPGTVSPTFEVVPHKPETAIAYRVEGDAVIFDVFSQSGIGGADVSLMSGPMPKQILLRFHLKGLESLQFAYGETVITLTVSGSETHDVQETVLQGGIGAQEIPLTPDSPYWMDVNIVASEGTTTSIPLEDGYFEVTFPIDFLQNDHRTYSLEWIDFYR